MNKTELIDKYALDVSINKLERLDEIVKLTNIDNDWKEDEYISFKALNNNIWCIYLLKTNESIYFIKSEVNPNYLEISSRFEEIKSLLNTECEKYDCINCPYTKECDEYSALYVNFNK